MDGGAALILILLLTFGPFFAAVCWCVKRDHEPSYIRIEKVIGAAQVSLLDDRRVRLPQIDKWSDY